MMAEMYTFWKAYKNLFIQTMYTSLALQLNMTAKAFVGTCTDMCPEKERYDREEKRRLHNYEVLQGTEGVGCVGTHRITC